MHTVTLSTLMMLACQFPGGQPAGGSFKPVPAQAGASASPALQANSLPGNLSQPTQPTQPTPTLPKNTLAPTTSAQTTTSAQNDRWYIDENHWGARSNPPQAEASL